MASKPVKNELASLITDAREQLTYFHELGVESIEACSLPRGLSPNPVVERSPQPLSRSPAISPTSGVNQFPGAPAVERFQEQLATDAATSGPSLLFADLKPPVQPLARSSETFEGIWADIGNCTRCPLYEARTHIVHTDGNHRARLMFVGEAPGADEDAQARPFVGRAGQLLTKIIEAIGFRREEVLIGNVNRCRPPANRPPTLEEAATCKPFLLREIAAVRPEVIVVLGNTAMRNLLDTKVGITKLRGHFQEYEGAKVMPTFHPAYLLRDPSKKKETWADLKKVRDYLESTRKRTD
ncbi:MAG TPA: uracil-DNA glycosylase [Pyrinomonadaceae bacterium]|nr:uracil-DNA glycosylase [Pyrinomonadaceae bacterium]